MIKIEDALRVRETTLVLVEGEIYVVPISTPLGEQALRAQIASYNLKQTTAEVQELRKQVAHTQQTVDSFIADLDPDL